MESNSIKLSRTKTKYIECHLSHRANKDKSEVITEDHASQILLCSILCSVVHKRIKKNITQKIRVGWTNVSILQGYILPNYTYRTKDKYHKTNVNQTLSCRE